MAGSPTLFVFFAQPRAEELDRYWRYNDAAADLFREAGAVVSPPQELRHLLGERPASVLGMARFPDHSTLGTVAASDAYQALLPDRELSLAALDTYLIADPPISELGTPDGVYAVILGTPNPAGADDLEVYSSGAGPLYGRYGARPVAQLQVTGRPGGDANGEFISLAEFDSADVVEALFSDPDYQALEPARSRGLTALDVYVTR